MRAAEEMAKWATHVLTVIRGRVELRVLLPLLLASAAAWVFVELADEVVEGSTRNLDTSILLAFRTDLGDPLGPTWVEEIARDLTALGGVAILTLVTLAAAGFLWLQGKPASMWLVLISVGAGMLLSTGLKSFFDRARPDLVPHEAVVYTASFPSGHSMLSAVAYLTLGGLLAQAQPRRLRIYLLFLASLLTFAVGLSRVYLGVHWPTDVLAGWTAGAAWAVLCWTIARWLQARTAGVN